MRERDLSRTAAPEQASRRTPSVHPLLALQRTAGNRAVNAVIARRRRGLDDELELQPEADAPGARAARGPQAPELGAVAHAHGDDVHLVPGQEEELLGHELWHVRQQRQGRVG